MDIWKSFFTEGVVKCRNGLPREMVELPSLEVFEESLCHGLVDRVVFGHKLDSMVSQVFSKTIETDIL